MPPSFSGKSILIHRTTAIFQLVLTNHLKYTTVLPSVKAITKNKTGKYPILQNSFLHRHAKTALPAAPYDMECGISVVTEFPRLRCPVSRETVTFTFDY